MLKNNLAVLPWGYDKMKLPEGPIVGAISWGVCLLLIGRIVWILLPFKRLSNAVCSVVVMGIIAYFVAPVVVQQINTKEATPVPPPVSGPASSSGSKPIVARKSPSNIGRSRIHITNYQMLIED